MTERDANGRATPALDNALAFLFAAAAIVLRLVPFKWNLAPVGALCLFGGARMRSWRAYVLPVAVMVLSDVGLLWLRGFEPFDPFVYGSFLLNVLLGRCLLRDSAPWRVPVVALAGSVQFFLITNFGSWLMGTLYAKDLGGLLASYVAGIPFYGPTLAGDLLYSALFFGLHAWAVKTQAGAAQEPA